MAIPMYAVVIARATAEQREQVHALVKEHANGWWHRFPDLWVVGGKTATTWRDLLSPLLASPASILVLKIDVDSTGTWSYWGRKDRDATDWFHRNL